MEDKSPFSTADLEKEKFILDACCGYRMMWFNKSHPNALFLDNRKEVNPDIIGDFRDLRFSDKSFKLIAWDVPHVVQREIGKGKVVESYGILNPDTWKEDLKKGFEECWRVLDDFGVLIFKWSDCDKWANISRNVNLKEVLKLFHTQPLFGHKTKAKFEIKENRQISSSYWITFIKIPQQPYVSERQRLKAEVEKIIDEEIKWNEECDDIEFSNWTTITRLEELKKRLFGK